MAMDGFEMARKKAKLTKLSNKIKRLVELHGSVRLEVYGRDYNSGGRNNRSRPYAMRHLYSNGNCTLRYWDDRAEFKGRRRQKSCFMESYSEYHNGDGQTIVKDRTLANTLRAMQRHDKGCYKIKYIYVGKRKIEV